MIAIVGNLDSTLAREAAVALDSFAEREAGPHGLVPTASVAVALAIGDALALTVMEAKGITREAFAANHPSGRLGRRLTLRVRDVMHAERRAGDRARRRRSWRSSARSATAASAPSTSSTATAACSGSSPTATSPNAPALEHRSSSAASGPRRS